MEKMKEQVDTFSHILRYNNPINRGDITICTVSKKKINRVCVASSLQVPQCILTFWRSVRDPGDHQQVDETWPLK